jgi:site-specific DNA-methyltransferase (cytosine-N4-specific)
MKKRVSQSTIQPLRSYHKTSHGQIFCGDSLALFQEEIANQAVDLIMTSPPFGLVRKKDYGNADAHEYFEWFRPFAEALTTDGC